MNLIRSAVLSAVFALVLPSALAQAPAADRTSERDMTPTAPASSMVAALAPRTIPFQGVLTDAGGGPVPDGSYSIGIGLFLTASGGTSTYLETHSATATDGTFSVQIGGGTLVSGAWSSVVFDRPWWIEVSVNGEAMTPRSALQTVPFTRGLSLPLSARSEAVGTAFSVTSSATSGSSYAGVFQSASDTGRGVAGIAAASSGQNTGVEGTSYSAQGQGVRGEAPAYGVFGETTAATGFAYGVWGESGSTTGRGVLGKATSATGVTYGVVGQSDSDAGRGVYGLSTSSTGTPTGVYGSVTSPNGYAGYFTGGQGVRVEGEIAASRVVYTSPRTHIVSIHPSAFQLEGPPGRPWWDGVAGFSIGFERGYIGRSDHSVVTHGPVRAPLQLPDGAEVTSFSCTVYDVGNLDVDISCGLLQFEPNGLAWTPTVLAATLSSSNSQIEVLNAVFTPFVINNSTSVYSVRVATTGSDTWSEEGESIGLMKVTVGYRVTEAE